MNKTIVPTELRVVRQGVLQRGESLARLAERRALIYIRVAQRRQRDLELPATEATTSREGLEPEGPTMLVSSEAA